MARQIPLRKLNQQTSAVVDAVVRGEAITVTKGGRPVARLVPVAQRSETLDSLVAEGLALSPSASGPFVLPPPTANSDVDVAAEIARERAEGRW